MLDRAVPSALCFPKQYIFWNAWRPVAEQPRQQPVRNVQAGRARCFLPVSAVSQGAEDSMSRSRQSHPASAARVRSRAPLTPLRRLAPPLAFMCALMALVLLCYDAGYSALPPVEKRYADAKSRGESLLLDARRSQQREPWEKLAEEFSAIYQSDTDWPNRPAALYRSAESLEQLARRSFAGRDARRAVERYEELALRHADSRLADDALYRSALVHAELLRDRKGARAVLDRLLRQYPRGDMAGKAGSLRDRLTAAAEDSTTIAESGRTAATTAEEPAAPSPRPAVKAAADPMRDYAAAKEDMAALQKDEQRACWREPWEKLEARFRAVHAARPADTIRAGALYRAAFCHEALARCSHLGREYREAVAMYRQVAQEFPRSALADDALYQAAVLAAHRLDDVPLALELLTTQGRKYPHGDMTARGRELLAELDQTGHDSRPSSGRQAASRPELQMLSWDSVSKNSVRVVLELNGPARYETRLIRAGKDTPARLVLEVSDIDVVQDVRRGVKVNGSLLSNVQVRPHGRGARIELTFREVARFDTSLEENPYRIVVSVAAGKSRLPRMDAGDTDVAEAPSRQQAPARRVRSLQVCNMASQLGLTVRRVFIDAGHGGKDPGTSHNKVVERAITLDIAQRLGRLLQANGLEVSYSRTDNTSVGLAQRTQLANRRESDIFVSIHVNAHDNASARGFETYFLDFASNPEAARVAALENARSDRRLGNMQNMLADVMLNVRQDESRRLAGDIQRLTIFRLKRRGYTVRNNGTRSAPFHVLLGACMPAVLVEVGYCTNPDEATRLRSEKYRHAIAEGLAEGILAYRDRLSKRHTAHNALTDEQTGAM